MSDRAPSGLVAAAEKMLCKLEGSGNYVAWNYHVLSAVQGFNLDGHLTGETVKPAVTKGSPTEAADTIKANEWERNDKAVRACIRLSLTTSLISTAMDNTLTAKQLWDKLTGQCRRNDMTTRGALILQIHTTKLKDAASAEQHVATMNGYLEQLAQMGKPMDASEAAFALLHSVPTDAIQWDVFLSTYHSKEQDPTRDGVCSAIRAEAVRQLQREKERGSTQPTGAAAVDVAYAAARGNNNNNKTGGRKFCTHCNRRGHVVDTCWDLHPNLRQKQPRAEVSFVAVINETNNHAALLAESGPSAGLWHVDSGASAHLTGNKDWFIELHQCSPRTVTTADHGVLTCTQRGTAVLITPHSRITIHDVLYVPSLTLNLVSVSALIKAGSRVRFTKTGCAIRSSRNKLVARAVALNNIYSIYATPGAVDTAYTVSSGRSGPMDWQTAHARMGHLSPSSMKVLLDKQLAVAPPTPTSGTAADIDHCPGCLAGKSHRNPIPTEATHRASRPLQIVHSDLCGPIQLTDADGKVGPKQYIITFIDDYSRFAWVGITADKTAETTLSTFVRYKVWAERYTGFKIQLLRTDGGGEYINDKFDTYLSIMGIERQRTTARTPQQNGVAERMNRTLCEAARAMLHAAGLPLAFWTHAVKTAAYLRNRSPTRALTNATPYEAWRGDKPDLSHLRAFGCRAYMHLDKTKRSKMEARSIPVIFVGYAPEAKAWLVYDPIGKQTHTSRDVTFHESVAGSTLLAARAKPPADNSKSSSSSSSGNGAVVAAEPTDTTNSAMLEVLVSENEDVSEDDGETEAKQPVRPDVAAEPIDQQLQQANQALQGVPRESQQLGSDSPATDSSRPSTTPPAASSAAVPAVGAATSVTATQSTSSAKKARKRGNRLQRELDNLRSYNALGNKEQPDEQQHDALFAFAVQVGTSISEPRTYNEAVCSPHRVQWERAMQDELDSIKANDTYTLVPLPPARQAIGCKWVYKIKRHADGSIDRYKARLVAKGYSQLHGIDFTETFAPVVRFPSLRAILAIAAAADYEIHQMDVKTAFLNGDLDEDIYMQQPDGYRAAGDQAHHVWKLNKSLYGLKQAGRAWNKKMDAALVELGFRSLHSDSCVYVRRDGSSVLFVLVYVDDLLLVANNAAQLANTKAALSSRFDMKDMGKAHFILGVQIRRNRAKRQLYLSQAEYVRAILERFGMQDCKPAASPMSTGVKLLKAESCEGSAEGSSHDSMADIPYASAVGALMYAALATRPDIAYAVTALCQFMSAPDISHWHAAKRVFRYLQGTQHHELVYGWNGGKNQPLYGYSDSDWGNDVNDRRSFTGWVFLLHDGAVSWQSCKQPTVALSSVEAEYMAATQATREAVWWRAFLTELGLPPTAATTIYKDSQGAIALGKNPEHHKRTKHIDIQHHYVREQVAAGTVVSHYISTDDMLADVLTKPLAAERHNRLAGEMGVRAVHTAD